MRFETRMALDEWLTALRGVAYTVVVLAACVWIVVWMFGLI